MEGFTKDQIFHQLQTIFAETFELDQKNLSSESRLYEDLGLDSIDAIDLIIKCQELTGKRIRPEEFKSVRTVQDVVDVLHAALK